MAKPTIVDLADPCRMLRAKQLAALLDVHPHTLWKMVKAGRLPKPVKLGPKLTAWRAREIQKLLDAAD